MRPNTTLFLLPICVFSFAASSCGLQETDGTLALKIAYNAGNQIERTRTNDQPPEGEAPADITDYRICVSSPGSDKPKCQNFNRADNPTGAKLGGLKPGDDRMVTFQGYDVEADYQVRWCGNASGISVQASKTAPVKMYISVCSDFTAVRTPMTIKRTFHTSTVLNDGRVLVAGGFSNLGQAEPCAGGNCHTLSATSSIDIYDPKTGRFEPQSGLELTHARALHTATLLPDGKVLIAGGAGKAVWRVAFTEGPRPVIEVDTRANGDNGLAGGSAELIDLTAKTVAEIPMAPASARAHHTAVPFSNGDVMLVGGIEPGTNLPINAIGRYGASTMTFESLPNAFATARQGMASTSFANNTFLLWGGHHANSSEPGAFAEVLYEDNEGAPFVFSPAFVTDANRDQGAPLFYGAASSPATNRVMTCGGMIVDTDYDPSLLDRVRILNIFRVLDMTPAAESFVSVGASTMRFPRAFHTATTVEASAIPGEAIVAGGLTYFNSADQSFELTDRVEFFDPAANAFEEKQIDSRSVALMVPRAGHAVSSLPVGTILFTGGLTNTVSLDITDTAEIYNPAPRSLRVE